MAERSGSADRAAAGFLNAGPREVQVEIRQVPGEQETPVHWQGIVPVERLPMIRTLFEDDGSFVALPPEPVEASQAEAAKPAAAPPPPAPPVAAVPASLVTDDKQSGIKAVLLSSGPRYQLDLRESLAIRERPVWGEFRFLRFAFRKKARGGSACNWTIASRRTGRRTTTREWASPASHKLAACRTVPCRTNGWSSRAICLRISAPWTLRA